MPLQELTANYAGTARRETRGGKEYVVAPVTMLVEGVHAGSQGALYYPADELARTAARWDGMPVTVGHPKDAAGRPVTANAPDTLERYAVGTVRNARYEGGRLRAEAWLDPDRMRRLAPAALHALRAGRKGEVSTGLYTQNAPPAGVWNGRPFAAVVRNHAPDHLAILTDGEGACSCRSGCGLNTNERGVEMTVPTKGIGLPTTFPTNAAVPERRPIVYERPDAAPLLANAADDSYDGPVPARGIGLPTTLPVANAGPAASYAGADVPYDGRRPAKGIGLPSTLPR